jgi:PAS domain S-box-containing protein
VKEKKKQKQAKDGRKRLRRQAEETLRTRSSKKKVKAPDLRRLVQELEIHQVELKIQNEELRNAQVQLAESRDRYSGLYEFAPLAYVTLDRDGRVLESNRMATKMLGVEARDLLHASFTKFVTTESQDNWYLHRQAVSSSETTQVCEIKIQSADGSLRSIRVESIAAGRPRMLSSFIDLTERKQAEDAIGQLAAIVECSDDAIVSKDLNGIIMSWNKGAEKLFGYAAEEVIGKSIMIVIPPDRANEETRVLESIRSGKKIDHYETVRLRKDGSFVEISLTVSPIRAESGNIIGASKIARDISERKRAEERIAADLQAMKCLHEVGSLCAATGQEFDKCLREIVSAAIVITGADKGNIQLLDPASDSLTIAAQRGFEEPFLKFFASVCNGNCACGAAMHSAERIIVEDVMQSEIFAGQPSLTLLDAGVRAVQSTPLVSSAGNLLGILSTHFRLPHRPGERELRLMDVLARQAADYLERKRTEEEIARLLTEEQAAREVAENATRAKDQFLALVSHELRSPLNAVLGWNRLLRSQQGQDPQIAKVTETIERNAKAQLQLIEDLLDTARIINGKMSLELQPVEPVAIISQALDTVRPSADSKGVVVLTDLDSEAGQITGDPDRLQQVVWNLLSNAIKFTPGGGRVRIELRRAGAGVQIAVSDTGRGISPDLLPYVFDRFKQGDAEFSRRHGGLGLGLALVKHLVELHGGTVVVESPGVGQGATFIVNLPVRAVKAVAGAETGETEANRYVGHRTRTNKLEGVRALVVDDLPGARELLSATLEQYGVFVTGVDSTEAALAAIESQFGRDASEPFDILISDIEMPGGDGYELMKRLRTHTDERVKRIRAIALTAYGRTEDRLRALQAGFQMHVPKPIDEEELTTVITAVIDH